MVKNKSGDVVVLKDGVVQQVDTPENLYDKPGNKFVAGFIGAPQMNMVDAEVKEDAEGVHLVFCGQSIKMDEKRAAILKEKGYIGKKVTLGIRPEDLYKVIQALQERGVTDIRTYKKDDHADRAAKIGEFGNLFFQHLNFGFRIGLF